MGFRVVVDFDRCESNALCMAAAPEVFEVREDDFLYVLQEEPPDGAARKCLEAARVCPKQAISIVDNTAALVTGGGSGIGLGAATRSVCDEARTPRSWAAPKRAWSRRCPQSRPPPPRASRCSTGGDVRGERDVEAAGARRHADRARGASACAGLVAPRPDRRRGRGCVAGDDRP